MRKSEYRQRAQELRKQFDSDQFHSFEMKLAAKDSLYTHARILNSLYRLSRSTRTLKQRIVDFFLGE